MDAKNPQSYQHFVDSILRGLITKERKERSSRASGPRAPLSRGPNTPSSHQSVDGNPWCTWHTRMPDGTIYDSDVVSLAFMRQLTGIPNLRPNDTWTSENGARHTLIRF